MLLSGLRRNRKQFGDGLAEIDIGGIHEERFERQFTTAVDFALRAFTAVVPCLEAMDECVNDRTTRMITVVDHLRTKEFKLFVRDSVKRSGNDTSHGRVVDSLVLAIAELLDHKVNGVDMFAVQFGDFGVRPAIRSFAKPPGEHGFER